MLWLTETYRSPPANFWFTFSLFGVLIVFTFTFSVSTESVALSLLPTTTLAAYLVLGLVPVTWLTFGGALIHEVIRQRYGSQLNTQRMPTFLGSAGRASSNAVLQTISIITGHQLYQQAGGQLPFSGGQMAIVPLVLLGIGYLSAHYLVASVFIRLQGQAALQTFWQQLSRLFIYEASPMLLAPLMALIYSQLGQFPFLIFATVLIATSLLIYHLAQVQKRLERQLKELNALQAVGHSLSASLDVDKVLQAVYEQVAQLMPIHLFYVALYDEEEDLLSFPLFMEEGQPQQWPSRQPAAGLTEYVLQHRQPLLIGQPPLPDATALGVQEIGQPSASWLGVPLLSGERALGVLAVQSFTETGLYDQAQADLLQTIANQAAIKAITPSVRE